MRRAHVACGRWVRAEQVPRRGRRRDVGESGRRPAVEDPSAVLAGLRTDIDDPVGAPDDVEIVLDDEDRVATLLQAIERVEQRLAVGGMQAGRRFVEDVDDAEQVRADLRGQPQALRLARRHRRGIAIERQVAEAEVDQDRDAVDHVARDPLRGDPLFLRQLGRASDVGGRRMARAAPRDALRGRLARRDPAQRGRGGRCDELAPRRRRERLGEHAQRQVRQRRDVEAREPDGQRLALQPPTVAQRAGAADHVARDALLHQRTLGRRERVQDVLAGPHERALVARLESLTLRRTGLGRREARIDRHGRLLVGEQDPVAIRLRQVAPRAIDVVAERHEDVAQVLAVPRGWPCRDGAFADRQRIVRDHRRFGDLEDASESMAARAGTLHGVRREILGVQHRLVGRIAAGARVQQAHEARERGHGAERRPQARRAALLLQRDCRRQSVDAVDVGHADLVDQASRVRRDRFEIASLRFGVERAEREGRLAGARHAGERDDRVARDVDVDVLQVVLACAANLDEGVRARRRGRPGRHGRHGLRAARAGSHRGRRLSRRSSGSRDRPCPDRTGTSSTTVRSADRIPGCGACPCRRS